MAARVRLFAPFELIEACALVERPMDESRWAKRNRAEEVTHHGGGHTTTMVYPSWRDRCIEELGRAWSLAHRQPDRQGAGGIWFAQRAMLLDAFSSLEWGPFSDFEAWLDALPLREVALADECRRLFESPAEE